MSSVRILIVEDDADHGRSLQEAISDLGYEVEVAATGEAGIEAFRARGADVVLTDLVLPDVDGIAVMQRFVRMCAARSGQLRSEERVAASSTRVPMSA